MNTVIFSVLSGMLHLSSLSVWRTAFSDLPFSQKLFSPSAFLLLYKFPLSIFFLLSFNLICRDSSSLARGKAGDLQRSFKCMLLFFQVSECLQKFTSEDLKPREAEAINT